MALVSPAYWALIQYDEEMNSIIDDPYIRLDLQIHHTYDDEIEFLRRFTCLFELMDISSEDPNIEASLGYISGWFAIAAVGRPIAIEADAISADSEPLGQLAETLISNQDWSSDVIENVLLIDRVEIKPEFRGSGYLAHMINALLQAFSFHQAGCFVVTMPEPQQLSGGPYPEGPIREKALSGLIQSLSASGFSRWKDSPLFYRTVDPHF